MALKDFLRFGPPKDDADKPAAGKEKVTKEERAQQVADGPQQHGWTAGANMATKATVGLLWLALIAGPVALGMRVFVPAQAQMIQTGTEASEPGELAAVSAFAERALVLWLETPHGGVDEEALKLIFGDVEQLRPRVAWTTDNVTVSDVEFLENRLWSVTMAVDVTDGVDPAMPAEERAEIVPVTRRMYFQIPIYYVNGDLRAQALPAVVPAPYLAEQQENAYRTNVGSAHPAYASVAEFLAALLTSGSNDKLERYTTPGSGIEAITPAPFSEIQISDLQATTDPGSDQDEPTDGQTLEVLATVRLFSADQQGLTSQYAISLLARQGRWEIAALHESPELRTPIDPNATPTQSTRRPDGSGDSGTDEQPDDEPTAPTTDGTEPPGTEPPATEPPATDPPAEEQPTDGSPPTGDPTDVTAPGGGESENS